MKILRLSLKLLTSLAAVLTISSCQKKESSPILIREENLTKNQKKFLRECRKNIGKSCYQLASSLHIASLKGDKRFKTDEIIPLYRRACRLKWSPACHNLGVIFERGLGGTVNLERSKYYYSRACSLENSSSCYNLGKLYMALRDKQKALKYLEKGCDLGIKKSCNDLGAIEENTPQQPKNWRSIERAYKRACSAGEPLGCYNLGRIYSIRNTPIFLPRRAKKFFLKSCYQKVGLGCYHLALLLTSGLLKNGPNYQMARIYFAQACEFSTPQGCNNLAVLYHRGLGGLQSRGRAELYYRKACKLGYKPACKNLKIFQKNSLFSK